MNYKNFNDYELLDYIYSCNEDANEILLYKYRPLIINIATKKIKYSSGGIDLNDLIQEGLLGLNEAIKSYNENKEAHFGTFAKICIERKMESYIKGTKTYKNKFLNESVNYDTDDDIIEKLLIDNSSNPSDLLENKEREKLINEKIITELTNLELQVFNMKKNNFTYDEISNTLDITKKAVDNAMQRIKRKLKKIIEE